MLVECEVWEQCPGSVRTPKGFSYKRMEIVRKVVDTDLFDWWSGVEFIKAAYENPYPDQCWVNYHERGKYPLIVPRKTLEKIREPLGGDKIVKI